MYNTLVVHGPQGCGKTRNANLLRDRFGCRDVVDEWDPQTAPLEEGKLHLTQADVADITLAVEYSGLDVVLTVSFTEAMST